MDDSGFAAMHARQTLANVPQQPHDRVLSEHLARATARAGIAEELPEPATYMWAVGAQMRRNTESRTNEPSSSARGGGLHTRA